MDTGYIKRRVHQRKASDNMLTAGAPAPAATEIAPALTPLAPARKTWKLMELLSIAVMEEH